MANKVKIVKRPDGTCELVDLGPMTGRSRRRKKFEVIVQENADWLPEWMRESPDYAIAIENPDFPIVRKEFKKRRGPTARGDKSRAATKHARQLMREGLTKEEAVNKAASAKGIDETIIGNNLKREGLKRKGEA
jgi:hypothetical protein